MQPLDYITLKTLYGEKIKALAAQYGIENVRVFGSVARGEADETSDIDLLYHGTDGCRPLTFKREIEEIFSPIKVDLVNDKSLHQRIAPYILKDAAPL